MAAKKDNSAWCAAPSCRNSRKKGWRMFRFPRDETRCKQWVQNCSREDLLTKPPDHVSRNCNLCSIHFEDRHFINPSQKDRGLNWNAVPTIFNHVLDQPTKRHKLPCYKDKSDPRNQQSSCTASEEQQQHHSMAYKKDGSAWCAAIQCRNSRKKGWTMFRFPKDDIRCRQWILNCRREDLYVKSPYYLYKNCFLCTDHFEDNQFINPKDKGKLVWNAVPTIFNVPSSPQTLTTEGPLPCPGEQLHSAKKMKKTWQGTDLETSKVEKNNPGVKIEIDVAEELPHSWTQHDETFSDSSKEDEEGVVSPAAAESERDDSNDHKESDDVQKDHQRKSPESERFLVEKFDCKCRFNLKPAPGGEAAQDALTGFKTGCIAQFSSTEVSRKRLGMAEITEAEKDRILLEILGGIPMNVGEKTNGSSYRQKERQHQRTTYLVDSKTVCRETFKFMYRISQNKLTALLKHFREHGQAARQKKWGGRQNSTKSLNPEDVERVVQFLYLFGEDRSCQPPDKVAALKRTDVKNSPSKMSIWRNYKKITTDRESVRKEFSLDKTSSPQTEYQTQDDLSTDSSSSLSVEQDVSADNRTSLMTGLSAEASTIRSNICVQQTLGTESTLNALDEASITMEQTTQTPAMFIDGIHRKAASTRKGQTPKGWADLTMCLERKHKADTQKTTASPQTGETSQDQQDASSIQSDGLVNQEPDSENSAVTAGFDNTWFTIKLRTKNTCHTQNTSNPQMGQTQGLPSIHSGDCASQAPNTETSVHMGQTSHSETVPACFDNTWLRLKLRTNNTPYMQSTTHLLMGHTQDRSSTDSGVHVKQERNTDNAARDQMDHASPIQDTPSLYSGVHVKEEHDTDNAARDQMDHASLIQDTPSLYSGVHVKQEHNSDNAARDQMDHASLIQDTPSLYSGVHVKQERDTDNAARDQMDHASLIQDTPSLYSGVHVKQECDTDNAATEQMEHASPIQDMHSSVLVKQEPNKEKTSSVQVDLEQNASTSRNPWFRIKLGMETSATILMEDSSETENAFRFHESVSMKEEPGEESTANIQTGQVPTGLAVPALSRWLKQKAANAHNAPSRQLEVTPDSPSVHSTVHMKQEPSTADTTNIHTGQSPEALSDPCSNPWQIQNTSTDESSVHTEHAAQDASNFHSVGICVKQEASEDITSSTEMDQTSVMPHVARSPVATGQGQAEQTPVMQIVYNSDSEAWQTQEVSSGTSAKTQTNQAADTGAEEVYVCEECQARFIMKSHLKRHMQKHRGNKPYACQQCNATFARSDGLTVHMRKHTGEKPYACQHCGATFSQSGNLKVHMRKHTGQRPYACQQCNATFKQSGNLITHMQKHTRQKLYTCEQCDATFTLPRNLKAHMRKHTGQKPYACDQCDATFPHPRNLKSHMQKHTGQKPYACDQCDAAYTRSDNLQIHMRKHAGVKPYVCQYCKAAFTQSSNLTVHLRKHTGQKPYACEQCNATFTQSGSLKSHMRQHTGVKYACEQCSATFSQPHNLKSHMRKHTGQNPYACQQCNATFKWLGSLNTHMLKHTGQRPHACQLCPATFKHSSNLKSHMLRHSGEKPFACDQCDAAYTRSDNLLIHMRKHTGHKPYACSQCSAAFTTSSNMKMHMLKHTGQKPYSCPQCSSTFRWSSNLKVHLRKHAEHAEASTSKEVPSELQVNPPVVTSI